jgi:Tfp pilus assembly protein PilF
MNAKNNLILALKDPDPLVRTTAVMGLNKLSDKEKITYLMPLCDDPIRAVRMNAAHACAGIPVSLLNMQQQSNLKRALTEYKTAQLAQIDQPEGNINLGAMAAMQGESKSAEKYYQTAIALDPTFSPSHLQLALLYISQDQKEKAQQVLKTATDRNRKNGELFYYYGLLLAEMGKPQESITALAQATELLPENVNVWYNYGLMLQKNGDISRAEKALLTLINLDINNPRSLQAIIMLYAQQKQWDDAYRYAEKLYQLNPADISTKKLLDEIILQKTSGH